MDEVERKETERLGQRLSRATWLVVLAVVASSWGCEARVSLGGACDAVRDCPPGLLCEYRRCRSACSANADCPANATCLPTVAGGACGVEIDLGCETGVGRECPDGLVCVRDRCVATCTSDDSCPIDGECRATPTAGVSFCFDGRLDAADAGPFDAGPFDSGRLVDLDANELGTDALPFSDVGADAGSASPPIVELSAGVAHTLARRADGSLTIWGAVYAGGSFREVGPPMAFALDRAALDIESGNQFACAIVDDLTLRCFGNNEHGNLGDGTTAPSFPDAVTPLGLTDVTVVATGAFHACAARTGGDVYCWGDNSAGQLGQGDRMQRREPTLVAGIQATALAAGAAHMCASTLSGDVYCWGRGGAGQNGSATGADRLTPERVPSLDASVMRATGPRAGDNHNCARVGSWITCWGADGAGQLGRGTAMDSADAMAISDRASFGPIATFDSGGDTSCAVGASGAVGCWGANDSGQLGTGSTGSFASTLDVRVIDALERAISASEIAVGLDHACAITPPGVMCWGDNAWGQLGDGTHISKSTATPIRE